MGRMKCLWLFLGVVLFTVSIYDVKADVIPSENECRPYIEKAIHELKNIETTATETDNIESNEDATTGEEESSIEVAVNDTNDNKDDNEKLEDGDEQDESTQEDDGIASTEEKTEDEDSKQEDADGDSQEQQQQQDDENDSKEQTSDDNSQEEAPQADENDSKEQADGEDNASEENTDETQTEEQQESEQANDESVEPEQADNESVETENTAAEEVDGDSKEEEKSEEKEAEDDNNDSQEGDNDTEEKAEESVEEVSRAKRSIPDEADQNSEQEGSQENAEDDNKSEENDDNKSEEKADDDDNKSQENAEEEDDNKSEENANESQEAAADENSNETENADGAEESKEGDVESQEQVDGDQEESQETANTESTEDEKEEEAADGDEENDDDDEEESNEEIAEEELTLEFEIPKNLRSRDHISDLLGLDAESSIKENALKRTGDVILKELKKTYDNAIKPLETLYKYRDLSNRHFGDPEIFSKPLVLFMGPWSGGKSTILNYLTENEYTPNSIRSGAEPSPAYFNILMHGEEPEVMDGTQLAADWTFSGLQKFGQGLLDRLRGQRLPNKLLERVNIVEIPGILEVRKQVSRFFPFNDACQWFIDRADIIFLVYDPSKLDVGPETEAILDQLKGREYQTRILLNKADQVKPEELLRVQSALIWNISPLMSSAQPPVMYTVSLWSHPFEAGSPVRLLQAQERALLSDLREAIDKRIENKIASARRFAVRIRNHAKMVDCYLTTYYNQKGLFSNKKQISDKIIEHPQNYNIYEGLSTLTNISRYDLPDPEVYLDFFRLNPLYEFKKLSETCTYFKGCPINKLDIAIAYDLPELVGKYKKLLEENYSLLRKEFDDNCINQSEPEPPVKIKSR